MKITKAEVMAGDQFAYNDEDGQAVSVEYYVIATVEDGTQYVHGHRYRGYCEDEDYGMSWYAEDKAIEEAEAFIEKVIAKGVIAPEHWFLYEYRSYANGEVSEQELMDDEELARYRGGF